MVEIKRFMITWYDDTEKKQKWAGYETITLANQAFEYLVNGNQKPKMLQMLRSTK